MIEHPIYARVCKDDGDYSRALAALNKMLLDYPVEISCTRWKPRRTDQQNRYLWGVVYAIIAQETGNDVNDLHIYFCGEFFGWQDYEVMGMKRLRPAQTSSKQIKARFSEFLEFIISKAASLGIIIPPPNHDLPESAIERNT